MNILLLGEYSNMHWTLAEGLRQLGHSVTVVSEGDRFKNYERNITIRRRGNDPINTLRYVFDLWTMFKKFKGYDVVQIVNPFFLELRPEKNFKAFEYLKRHNKKVFLGAFGDDYYWVKTCLEKKVFRYSDFDMHTHADMPEISKHRVDEWIGTVKEEINRNVAQQCDGIIACLYEYYKSYEMDFGDKLIYLPCPINTDEIKFKQRGVGEGCSVKIFIGIQSKRTIAKGTDVLLKVLKEVNKKYPNESELVVAQDMPFVQYLEMLNNSDVLIDQLYSYTPGMNALSAMAQGMPVLSGGEPEYYEFIGEKENHPIINTYPSEEDIFQKLENLILNKEQLSMLSQMSRDFVEKHHNYINVAQQYLDFWQK